MPSSLELGDFCLSLPLQYLHYLVGNNLLLYHFQVSLVKVISLHVWYTCYNWGGGDSYKIDVKPFIACQPFDLGFLLGILDGIDRTFILYKDNLC